MAAINEGTSGSQVIDIQRKVGLRPDGYYDRLTKSAVKTWQNQNGLPATGIVDDNTWNAMFPPPSIVKQEVEPVAVSVVEQVEQTKPTHIQDGPEEDKADTSEVDRILSRGSNKGTNRIAPHRG